MNDFGISTGDTILQKGYKATIWIICLLGTQDEKWVKSALQNFDSTKIEYIHYKNLEKQFKNIKL